MRATGRAIADAYPFIDPFAKLESSNYTNIALVYAGASWACACHRDGVVQATRSSPRMLQLPNRFLPIICSTLTECAEGGMSFSLVALLMPWHCRRTDCGCCFSGSAQLYELVYLLVPGFVLAYVVVVLWATNGRIAEFCCGHLPSGTSTTQIRILKATSVCCTVLCSTLICLTACVSTCTSGILAGCSADRCKYLVS